MERAVRHIGGQIQFSSAKGEGFAVRAAVPVTGKTEKKIIEGVGAK
ncbi:MAG: hypothetical protein FWF88_03755 [Peptococcaceae bacterium]|nr:hypothetical protein [Peptococcaceae bacterium]